MRSNGILERIQSKDREKELFTSRALLRITESAALLLAEHYSVQMKIYVSPLELELKKKQKEKREIPTKIYNHGVLLERWRCALRT